MRSPVRGGTNLLIWVAFIVGRDLLERRKPHIPVHVHKHMGPAMPGHNAEFLLEILALVHGRI
jgi:hypothetical protein